jgi:hypothetical protein
MAFADNARGKTQTSEWSFVTESDIPDAVKYNTDLLKMRILLLETCRGI